MHMISKSGAVVLWYYVHGHFFYFFPAPVYLFLFLLRSLSFLASLVYYTYIYNIPSRNKQPPPPHPTNKLKSKIKPKERSHSLKPSLLCLASGLIHLDFRLHHETAHFENLHAIRVVQVIFQIEFVEVEGCYEGCEVRGGVWGAQEG